ncbi:MAG: biopolymer transporter ExbD [Deltaproteobacteria bacterium]|nr:biopolymer transporter ExbD [Deltaproteobacteria bacterium]
MGLKRRGDVEDLDLIPIMNLFVTMIPLLLLTAAFYHIGMVNASIPTQSDEQSDVPTSRLSVAVNVRMTDKGFELTASNAAMTEEELAPLSALIPKKGGSYDYARLTEVLGGIKRKFEKSDTMILFPNKKADYGQLIEAMDAARYFKRVKESEAKLTLFPVVVVASMVE